MANSTKAGKAVMDILKASFLPVSVKTIYQKLHEQGIDVWLSTVYRILYKFEGEGLVVKTTLSESDNKFYELIRDEHKHYVICLHCDKIVCIDICPVNDVQKKIESKIGFEVVKHKFELYGYCKECK